MPGIGYFGHTVSLHSASFEMDQSLHSVVNVNQTVTRTTSALHALAGLSLGMWYLVH